MAIPELRSSKLRQRRFAWLHTSLNQLGAVVQLEDSLDHLLPAQWRRPAELNSRRLRMDRKALPGARARFQIRLLL